MSDEPLTGDQAAEWADAARWSAARGYKGDDGDPLPQLLSARVKQEIEDYRDLFQEAIRLEKYAQQTEARNRSERIRRRLRTVPRNI